ncbi:hypothetical protein CIW48_32195 [Methylobacterium sp. P1-11]|nr:hypothetical protein CIW48_32195 [Methylobacterium sp. P1-11]
MLLFQIERGHEDGHYFMLKVIPVIGQQPRPRRLETGLIGGAVARRLKGGATKSSGPPARRRARPSSMARASRPFEATSLMWPASPTQLKEPMPLSMLPRLAT